MSDIVDRLNDASYENAPSRCMEAARDIERLRQRVAVLEMVILEELTDCDDAANQMIVDGIRERRSPEPSSQDRGCT